MSENCQKLQIKKINVIKRVNLATLFAKKPPKINSYGRALKFAFCTVQTSPFCLEAKQEALGARERSDQDLIV